MAKNRTCHMTDDKAANFKSFAGNRASMALVALQRLAKTGNRANYAPTAADLDKIEAALVAEVKATMFALRNGYRGDTSKFSL